MQCSFPAMDSASHAMVPLTNICILQGATEAKQGVYHKPSSQSKVTIYSCINPGLENGPVP